MRRISPSGAYRARGPDSGGRVAGSLGGMPEDNDLDKGITSPSEPTHEATTPPGNQEVDQEALRKAEEELEKPGGGH